MSELLNTTLIASAVALVAVEVAAEPRVEWRNWSHDTDPAYVEMERGDLPGTYTVTFVNRMVHTGSGEYVLTLDGVEVDIILEWQASGNDERITILPRGPWISIPPELTVPEDDEQVAVIYPAMM